MITIEPIVIRTLSVTGVGDEPPPKRRRRDDDWPQRDEPFPPWEHPRPR